MNIVLYIDTSDSLVTKVALIKAAVKKEYTEKTGQNKSQNLLPLIEKVLKLEKLTLADLTAIEVNPGPGSFTGVRVGVAVANTLGWVLKLKVNGKRVEQPVYGTSRFD